MKRINPGLNLTMTSYRSHAFLLLLIAVDSIAAVPGLKGACLTQNFTTYPIDAKRFAGAWYEISHSDSFFWDRGCQCTTAEYFPLAETTKSGQLQFRVLNTCRKSSVNGGIFQRDARARQIAPGHLKVNFFAGIPLADADYRIFWVDDSYTNAAIVSCSRFGGSLVWIISREPVMADATKEMLLGKLRDAGFVLDDLVNTKQTGCWSLTKQSAQFRQPLSQYSTAVPPACSLQTTITSFPVDQLEARWHILYTQPDFVENIFSHDCACNTVTLKKSWKIDDGNYPGTFQAAVVCRKQSPFGKRSEFVRPVYEISNLTSQMGHFTQKLYGGVSNEHWQILAYGAGSDVVLSKPTTAFDPSNHGLEHMMLYTCLDTKLLGQTFCIHIISKSNTISTEAVQKYIQLAKERGLFKENIWRKVLHSNSCPYDPQPLLIQ